MWHRQFDKQLAAQRHFKHLEMKRPPSAFIAADGQPFHDAEADEALRGGLRETLASEIETHEYDDEINDPAFAHAMAERLHELIGAQR